MIPVFLAAEPEGATSEFEVSLLLRISWSISSFLMVRIEPSVNATAVHMRKG
jgi:hypothetical protein